MMFQPATGASRRRRNVVIMFVDLYQVRAVLEFSRIARAVSSTASLPGGGEAPALPIERRVAAAVGPQRALYRRRCPSIA